MCVYALVGNHARQRDHGNEKPKQTGEHVGQITVKSGIGLFTHGTILIQKLLIQQRFYPLTQSSRIVYLFAQELGIRDI